MRRSLALALLLAPAWVHAQDCEPDAALERAAEILVARDEAPSATELLATVREAGSDVPVVDALMVRDGDSERRARFLLRSRQRRDGPLACGDARLGDRWLVLAGPRAGRLAVLGSGAVRVELAPGFREARLHAQDATGALWQAEAHDGARVTLPSELVAPIRVQLVATGPSGPRPVAERLLTADDAPPTEVARSDRPIGERLTALRRSELRGNRLLGRVASAHAEEVCRAGRVSHLAPTGDPRERLARAGLRARHVGEVVARAEDADRAYAAFLRSPSHRAALADRRFTDVGIGQAEDTDGRTCLVVLLAAWPRAVPP